MKKLKRLITLCVMSCVMVMASSCSVVDPMLAKVNGILHDVLKKHQYVTEWTNDETNHWNSCKMEGCKEVANKAAHTYDDGKVTTPATEETEGVMTYTCTACGYEKTETVEKLVHSHNLTKVNEVAATCTAAGTKAYYTCSGCDSIFSDAEGKNEISKPETIKKLDHLDSDKDHKCDTCPEVMGTHEAASGKHACDYCGKKVNDCADEDKDHDCDVCGTAMGTHEAANGKHTCDYCGEKVTDCENNYDEGKITTPATCTEKGVKKYTCQVCGESKTGSVPATGHKDENSDGKCDSCQENLCTEHQAGEAVVENNVPATCKAAGSYDSVVYCSVCSEEISRETVTVNKLAHTPAEAVKENEVAPTYEKEGSYDNVVYCSVCNEEISRETVKVDKLTHTPAEAVKENEVEASCKAEGSYELVVYCADCNEELSRETVKVDKLAHTPAEAVKENVVDPISGSAGSYDSVAYCSICGEVASKETIVLPAFNGTDYNTEATFGKDSQGTATVVYTLKADESFTYTVNYTSNLAIKMDGTLTRYVPDTLDAVNIPHLTVFYTAATDTEAAYYTFASIDSAVTVEKLLAYGDASVVIMGDVVINHNEKVSNNGGFIVGSATVPGNVTINQTAAQDGMQLWNGAYITVENGTLTINGYEGIASNKTAIYSSGCAINVKEKGNFVVNNYNNMFTGSATLTLDNDFVANKNIGCKSIKSTARLIIDNGATVKVEGSGTAVDMTKILENCINEDAEFGYDHALFVKNGTLTVTGNIKATGIQVGSVANGTKGCLNVSSDGDALTRGSGNVQYDFVNGEALFDSTKTGKSLIMVNNASAKINVNIMQNCSFSVDNYKYVFYLNSGNTVSSFNYFAENLTLINCTNSFVSANVNVNVKTLVQMEVTHEGKTANANVILAAATQTGCTAVDGNYAPTTSNYASYEFVSWVE